jgi:hypothetical protein
MLFDRSSSMRRFGTAPRDALNSHLDVLRVSDAADRIAVQVVTFDRHMEIVLPFQRVSLATDVGQIVPGHGTRLYGTVRDAMLPVLLDVNAARALGFSIDVVVAVFTDGENSCGTIFDQAETLTVAAQALRRGWELHTFGFGVNATLIASDMGFPADLTHAHSLDASAQAIHRAVTHTTMLTARSAMQPLMPSPDQPAPSTPR